MTIFSVFLASALFLLFSPVFSVDSKNNPADELVAVINANRTADKSAALFDNPGLGCLALQYLKAYGGQCGEVGGMKKPSDSSFADTFAPNCGVEAQSLAPITGRFLGCQSKYVNPEEAFSAILIQNSRSLQILHDKNHTEVGAAVSGTDGGSPYFWCVLLSSGKKNGSFAFENGEAKPVHPGCFSGNNDDCSASTSTTRCLASSLMFFPFLWWPSSFVVGYAADAPSSSIASFALFLCCSMPFCGLLGQSADVVALLAG